MENEILSKTDCRPIRNNKPLTAAEKVLLANQIDPSGKWRDNLPEEKVFTAAQRKRTVSLINQTTGDIINHPDMGQEDAVIRGDFERQMKSEVEAQAEAKAKESMLKDCPAWALALMQSYQNLSKEVDALRSK